MKTMRFNGLTVGIAFVAMLGVAQAQPAPLPTGSAIESAIVLPGATNELAGVAAEYAYIRQHFPGWKPGTQALLTQRARQYDRIELTGPDGAKRVVFFDISAWFGK